MSALHAATVQAGTRARSRPALFYLGLLLFSSSPSWPPLSGPWRYRQHNTTQDWQCGCRLSSPAPDPSILIVDIDERSLALMAPAHGRWPWPRSVIAETVAGLPMPGQKSILVNFTFSDPDKDHPTTMPRPRTCWRTHPMWCCHHTAGCRQ